MILFSYQVFKEDIMKIVIKLEKILADKGFSQHKLANLTGIRQPTINEMCRNQSLHIPLKNLAKICEVLECEITDILELVKEQP